MHSASTAPTGTPPVTLCDPIWQVNSSSGVATLVSELLYPCYCYWMRPLDNAHLRLPADAHVMRLPVKAHHLWNCLLMYTYVRSPVDSHMHDTACHWTPTCNCTCWHTHVHVYPFNTHTQMHLRFSMFADIAGFTNACIIITIRPQGSKQTAQSYLPGFYYYYYYYIAAAGRPPYIVNSQVVPMCPPITGHWQCHLAFYPG